MICLFNKIFIRFNMVFKIGKRWRIYKRTCFDLNYQHYIIVNNNNIIFCEIFQRTVLGIIVIGMNCTTRQHLCKYIGNHIFACFFLFICPFVFWI